MATLLRRASLRRAIASAAASCPEVKTLPAPALSASYRQVICGSSFHCRDFASKAKKKSKSSGTDSGEENMSKKDLALHQAIDQITTSFGKGAIMWLGRSEGHREVPVVSTGSFSLDLALGIGGLPKGRVIEVYGPEASGKTTLALHVIAEAQKLSGGGYCAFVDAEHALDPTLAESIGVDTSNLLLSQPDSAEQALSLVDTLIRSGSVDVVVVDSVAALVPKTELDGEMGDAHVALQARLMSQALRKLSHSLSLSQTVLLFINQIRSKVQTFGGGFGGPQEVTSGGNALKFYASVRLNIRRIGMVKKGEEIIGSQVTVKIVKNKHAPPFRTAQFELEFGKGICRSSELFELGLKHKLVKKTGGAYYSFNEQQFHGKDAVKSFLTKNEGAAKELEMELRRLIQTEPPRKQEAEDDMLGDLPEETVRPETSEEEDLAAIIEA
ncbi:DNA repair protein recA-like protein 3, mitochondrial [Hordeum vulgare]|nr:DNA repair protein recA-like protein 3, mitochondrial [Hordeum vulgare]